VLVLDKRATPEQCAALLRILGDENAEPAATIFQAFAITCDKVYDPIISGIDFELDIGTRTARARIDGVLETRGAPILDPVTGAEHRVRIEPPRSGRRLAHGACLQRLWSWLLRRVGVARVRGRESGVVFVLCEKLIAKS
jgi:hypothetical protein